MEQQSSTNILLTNHHFEAAGTFLMIATWGYQTGIIMAVVIILTPVCSFLRGFCSCIFLVCFTRWENFSRSATLSKSNQKLFDTESAVSADPSCGSWLRESVLLSCIYLVPLSYVTFYAVFSLLGYSRPVGVTLFISSSIIIPFSNLLSPLILFV